MYWKANKPIITGNDMLKNFVERLRVKFKILGIIRF